MKWMHAENQGQEEEGVDLGNFQVFDPIIPFTTALDKSWLYEPVNPLYETELVQVDFCHCY